MAAAHSGIADIVEDLYRALDIHYQSVTYLIEGTEDHEFTGALLGQLDLDRMAALDGRADKVSQRAIGQAQVVVYDPKVPADEIRLTGRGTQGVRVVSLNEGDKVVAATRVAPDATASDASGGTSGTPGGVLGSTGGAAGSIGGAGAGPDGAGPPNGSDSAVPPAPDVA